MSSLTPQDIGAGKGKYYAVNYPLRDGIDDESYEAIFKPVSEDCSAQGSSVDPLLFLGPFFGGILLSFL